MDLKLTLLSMVFMALGSKTEFQSIRMLVLPGKQSNQVAIDSQQVCSRRECAVRCASNLECWAANVIRRRRDVDDVMTCQLLSHGDAEDDLEDNVEAEYLYGERLL